MKKHVNWVVLIVLTLLIKIFSVFPLAVEKYYSNGIYPPISRAQRILFGWIPFSVGDILYGIAVGFLIYKLYWFFRRLMKKTINKKYFFTILKEVAFAALAIYVAFNLLWGLNYNRKSLAQQLQLKVELYNNDDLFDVVEQLAHKVNSFDSSAKLNRHPLKKKPLLFEGATVAYENLTNQTGFFDYSSSSIKPSLYSYLGNFLGFTGYYNPFTGESQVNTTVPVFIQPFITCHEIGHQLGYAKESEANFAAYLSGNASQNPAFKYSVYFDLYLYARYYLYRQDSLRAKQLDAQLQPGVKEDYRHLEEFIRKHENPIEKIIDKLYGQYLKANQQPSGKISYNEVILLLVAYYKKYRTL